MFEFFSQVIFYIDSEMILVAHQCVSVCIHCVSVYIHCVSVHTLCVRSGAEQDLARV